MRLLKISVARIRCFWWTLRHFECECLGYCEHNRIVWVAACKPDGSVTREFYKAKP